MDGYQVTRAFLAFVLDFFSTILEYEVISGITLGTVLAYNFLFVCLFMAFTAKR